MAGEDCRRPTMLEEEVRRRRIAYAPSCTLTCHHAPSHTPTRGKHDCFARSACVRARGGT